MLKGVAELYSPVAFLEPSCTIMVELPVPAPALPVLSLTLPLLPSFLLLLHQCCLGHLGRDSFPEPRRNLPSILLLCNPACVSIQVEAFPEPQRNLRLDIQLSIPKWGKACGWSARDDAMLMLGVHWHGLAHWENIAADER